MIQWIVVGLGNPGASYEFHRHNVGFRVVQALREAFSYPAFKVKEGAAISAGESSILLCLPQTYMNLSGQAVAPLVRFYKVPLTQVVVIHDDLDLPCGEVRWKQGGGTGGHRGLQSLSACIGPEYSRIRIGIGHPGSKDAVSSYVLSPFRPAERPIIEKVIQACVAGFPLILQGNPQAFIQSLKP